MPELPEVELSKRILKDYLSGKRLVDFWCDRQRNLKSKFKPQFIAKQIKGLKVKNLSRQGKVLFLNIRSPDNLVFAIHLRMSGALLFGEPKTISKYTDKKYVHFIWKFERGKELWLRDIRKFGIVWYGKKEELMQDKYLSSLGPDALSLSFKKFKERVYRHRGQLKPLLLNQTFIAGLGNIMVDESLWEAKLYPGQLATSLSDNQLKTLYNSIQRVLKRTIKAEGNTMRDWILPDGRTGKAVLKWKVYGREKKPCLRCGVKIKKIVLSSRGTHFCPKCQKR